MPLNEEDLQEEEEDKYDENFNKYQIELKTTPHKIKTRKLNRIISEENFTTSIGRTPSEMKNHSFSRDQFKSYITSTYNDWYFDRTAQWDYLDYLEAVS